jgi:CPA2 family monovalent cation:H+ antiporter-2
LDSLISLTTIALIVVVALTGGLLLVRLKQPPILGYILTGVFLGPSGFGIVKSYHHIELLAELGVLLLLFVIGMELNLRTFKRVWGLATLCTIAQIAISLVITFLLSLIFSWSLALSLLFGFVIALSSTAVVVKMLESIGELKTDVGQFAVGILIAQDLAVIPMILILKNSSSISFLDFGLIAKLVFSMGLIITLINYFGKRQRVKLPLQSLIYGDKDLFPLVSLAICFAASAIAGFIGLSSPYGAFLAGLILGNTNERGLMIETTKPIQSILMMVFFLSIGFLLDLSFVFNHIGVVIILLFIITLGKTALNISIFRFFRLPWSQAFLIGVVLAQLGEFSFLMATISYNSKIINDTGYRLVVALTVLSLGMSPVWMTSARRLKLFLLGTPLSFNGILNAVCGQEILYIRNFFKKVQNRLKNKQDQKAITYLNKDEDKKD